MCWASRWALRSVRGQNARLAQKHANIVNMEALTPGLIAELACSMPSWLELERRVVELLEQWVGADTVFFLDQSGPTVSCRGVLADTREQLRREWPTLERTASPGHLVNAALARNGVVVDSELFGTALCEQPYYHVFMAPVRGYTTLFGLLTGPERNTRPTKRQAGVAPRGEVVLGRCVGSKPFTCAELELLATLLPTLSLAHRALNPESQRLFQAALTPLTPREREVVSYLHLGYTNREIGVALGTQERTVRNQLSQIYEKLGVSNRAEAVGLVT